MIYFSWKNASLCQTCKHLCKHIRIFSIPTRLIGCPKYEKKDYSYLWKNRTNLKPTRPERIFDSITPKSVKYVGDGNKWIKLKNGQNKNPDFVIDGQKKVIEVFGDYWHRKGTRNDDPQELIDSYKQVGLNCLVIWEHEIYKNIDLVKQKADNFIIQ